MSRTTEKGLDRKEPAIKGAGYKAFPQLLTASTATLIMMANGMVVGWSAAALPKLERKTSDLYLTSDEGAWVVSALQMGAIFGPLLCVLLVNRIGRKWFLFAGGFPYLICWILVYCSKSFVDLFAARFICGIAVGASFSVAPMYLSEISETRIRGTVGTMSGLMIATGSLVAYCIGPWLEIKPVAIINLVPVTIFLLAFPWMPESPYYYLRRGNVEAAKKSLAWLRSTDSVQDELNEMEKYVEFEMQQKGTLAELITVPSNRRATVIVWLLFSAQQLSGFGVFMSYTNLLLERTSTKLDPNIAGIITMVVLFVAHLIPPYIVDRVGRKPLILISSYGTSACLCLMGLYFSLEAIVPSFISWLPLIIILVYYIFHSLGISPLPYAILSEIFPITVKAWATTIASIYGSITGVFATKIYQVVADAWGYPAIFFIFFTFDIAAAIGMSFALPETKGKSFKEIQEMLGKTEDKVTDVEKY